MKADPPKIGHSNSKLSFKTFKNKKYSEKDPRFQILRCLLKHLDKMLQSIMLKFSETKHFHLSHSIVKTGVYPRILKI